jgi:hypothetical protein
VAALTVGAFLVRLALLLESPEPPGTDGYYYEVQVEHWLAEGRFHVRDASWVLRVIALGCGVFGGPVVGVKGVSALLAAMCVPAAWFAGLALGRAVGQGMATGTDTLTPALSRRERGVALGLAAWAAASPTLTHLAGDFPKTLGAVAPLLVVLAWVVSGRRGWGALLGGMVAVLLAATAHRLGASLLGLGAVGAGLGLVLPLTVCLFPLWRRDVLDLGYRISLLAPLLAAPLVLLALPTARLGLHREDVFEAFLARAREEGDEDLAERLADWHNPSAVRPASLLRNRD